MYLEKKRHLELALAETLRAAHDLQAELDALQRPHAHDGGSDDLRLLRMERDMQQKYNFASAEL